jgi:hypothetical protein
MFHESFWMPQRTIFRSDEVAGFPFEVGSIHTVMTPSWTPGLRVL